MTTSKRAASLIPVILPAMLIIVATWWIYAPVLHGDWLWDDQDLIANNVPGRDSSQWWKDWLEPGRLVDYQPLKATVVCLQWFLWGNHPFGYHLTNVVLHAANALLVWRLLARLGLGFAWVGGLLFAIHPLQVESVAWIAELKNTLSLTPLLAAMCFYLEYDERRSEADYFRSLAFFLVALVCKADAVAMFPFILLVYAWWKRSRVDGDDLKRSAPFFAAAAVIVALAACFSRGNSVSHQELLAGGVLPRIAAAGLAVAFFLSKFFWPFRLLPLYPPWPLDPPSALLFLPAPIFAGLLAWFWLKREDWGRHALLGIGFFLINLVPVLAFIALKYRDMAWSLDHLIYLPSIGLCELVAAAGEGVRSRLPAKVRILAGVLAALVLLGLAWESHRYAAKFVDQKTLWTYALRYNSDAGARNNLGDALQREGRMAEAILQYREALRAKPGYAEAHNNLANALLALGQFPEAQAEYEEALRLKSTYAEPHNGLGNILTLTGKMDAAGPQYAEALELKPDYPEALNGLGNVLLHAGRIPEAEAKFEQALELNPDYAEAHCNLGLVFVQTGRLPEAIAQFEIAQRLKPNDARIARVLESLRAAPK